MEAFLEEARTLEEAISLRLRQNLKYVIESGEPRLVKLLQDPGSPLDLPVDGAPFFWGNASLESYLVFQHVAVVAADEVELVLHRVPAEDLDK